LNRIVSKPRSGFESVYKNRPFLVTSCQAVTIQDQVQAVKHEWTAVV